jgi:hypothetical protein
MIGSAREGLARLDERLPLKEARKLSSSLTVHL